jgi:signal transduction histidine kinase
MGLQNKILIVDDDAAGARATARILRRERFAVEIASSGVEALAALATFNPDLVLLDIVMPGIDGYEVCRRVRASERTRLTKIILVSGQGSVEERLRGYEAGADDYVAKPYDPAELLAKVRVFLRLKRAEEIDKLRGDLIVLLGHETRTPLAGIIGMAEVLLEEAAPEPALVRTCAEHIRACGNDLLEFHRKTTLLCDLRDGVDLERLPDLFDRHVEQAAAALAKKAAAKAVTVAIAADAGPPILLDWTLVDDVVTFLLDNAIKFAPRGSAVAATVTSGDDAVRFEVRDAGPGIASDWTDKIFDEFAVRDLAHHQKGQGLSLAIARHVAQHHGGTIAVASEPGHGALFTLVFPRWQPPVASLAPGGPAPPP